MQDLRAKRHDIMDRLYQKISRNIFGLPVAMMIFAKPQAGPAQRIALEDKKLEKFSMPASSTQPLKIVFELILNHDLCLSFDQSD